MTLPNTQLKPFTPWQPRSPDWTLKFMTPIGQIWHRYRDCRAYMAITSTITTSSPDRFGGHPIDQWMISFSALGDTKAKRRTSAATMRWIRGEWGMGQDWEEDNHESGIARKFFLPVLLEHRGIPCPCKDEQVITEGDYAYSVKKPLLGAL